LSGSEGGGASALPTPILEMDARLADPALVRLRVRTNSGVKVPVGQNTGCP